VPQHCRVREIDRDLIRGGHYGQRSCEPHTKAEHMAAPTRPATRRKSLPTRSRPHMAHRVERVQSDVCCALSPDVYQPRRGAARVVEPRRLKLPIEPRAAPYALVLTHCVSGLRLINRKCARYNMEECSRCPRTLLCQAPGGDRRKESPSIPQNVLSSPSRLTY
jgi:hypothetical protein